MRSLLRSAEAPAVTPPGPCVPQPRAERPGPAEQRRGAGPGGAAAAPAGSGARGGLRCAVLRYRRPRHGPGLPAGRKRPWLRGRPAGSAGGRKRNEGGSGRQERSWWDFCLWASLVWCGVSGFAAAEIPLPLSFRKTRRMLVAAKPCFYFFSCKWCLRFVF